VQTVANLALDLVVFHAVICMLRSMMNLMGCLHLRRIFFFSHRALELASALDDDASIVLAYAQ